MKTISKREGKNYEIEVKGDLHKYPDGSVHTVKEGKAVWEEGSGDSGGSGGGVVYATFASEHKQWICDKTFSELKTVYDNHGLIIGVLKHEYNFPSPLLVIMYPVEDEGGNIIAFSGIVSFLNYNSETNKMDYLTGGFGIGQDDSVVVDLVFKTGLIINE